MSFTYRDGACRTLEPWGMTSARRWYVIGRDIGRTPRGCSSSRIQDRPKNVSRPGAYSVPENLDLRLARSLTPRAPTASALLAIRTGKAPALRRRGTPSRATVALPGGFEVYSVGYSELRFVADEVVRYAPTSSSWSRWNCGTRFAGVWNAWPRHDQTGQARHDITGAGSPAAQPGALPSRSRRSPDGRRRASVRHLGSYREDDLNVLWMCGMPGLTPGDLIDIDMDAVDGEGVIHLSNADYLTRPLRLSAEEAMALVLGLQTLHEIAGPGDQDAVERALKKLEEAAARSGRPASVSVTAARGEIQARVRGLRAVAARPHYDVASPAKPLSTVDPLRLFVLEGYGYLEAWCYPLPHCGRFDWTGSPRWKSPISTLLRTTWCSRTCRQAGSRR